jgi:tripartite-type tricarboxylate transporter receptor subunit TctC
MSLTRRHALALAGLAASAPRARAQSWPDRPIRVIVPYAAGGADTYIRPLQERLSQRLGQPVVIDPVVGGGGAVGANRVRAAAPDGHTILFAGTGSLTAVPRLQKLDYSIADFTPIAHLLFFPNVVAARRNAPFSDFAGFLAAARTRPEGLSYGTPGTGSAPHLAAEAMAKAAGIRLLHVPFTGIATAAVALLSGDIDLICGAPSVIMPMQERGVRPLVQTGARRIATLPDLPTLKESGIDLDMVVPFGFLAPQRTSPAIVERFSATVRELAAERPYVEAMGRLYNEIDLMDAAGFRAFLEAEDRMMATLLRELNLT